MKTTFENEFKELEMRIRRQQREEIEDMLWHRYIKIDRILTENYKVLVTTYGERFNRMIKLRQKLYAKMDIISKMIIEISKMQ